MNVWREAGGPEAAVLSGLCIWSRPWDPCSVGFL